jgi:hypothetical protein
LTLREYANTLKATILEHLCSLAKIGKHIGLLKSNVKPLKETASNPKMRVRGQVVESCLGAQLGVEMAVAIGRGTGGNQH